MFKKHPKIKVAILVGIYTLFIIDVFLVLYTKLPRRDIAPIMIAVASMLISLTALLSDVLIRYFFSPYFEVTSRKIYTENTKDNKSSIYCSIAVKNTGFSVANNVEIKIKDNKNKEWVNLMRPFYGQVYEACKKDAIIHEEFKQYQMISRNQEEDFNLFALYDDDTGHITSDIHPKSQKLKFNKEDNNQQYEYTIAVICNTINPQYYKIYINKKEFKDIKENKIDEFVKIQNSKL